MLTARKFWAFAANACSHFLSLGCSMQLWRREALSSRCDHLQNKHRISSLKRRTGTGWKSERLLCIMTRFCVLRTPESWSTHFLGAVLNFFAYFKCFSVIFCRLFRPGPGLLERKFLNWPHSNPFTNLHPMVYIIVLPKDPPPPPALFEVIYRHFSFHSCVNLVLIIQNK